MEVRIPLLRLVRRDRVKLALSIRELVKETSEFSVSKAKNCTAQFYFADPKRLLLVYRVKCGESYSSKQGHKVRVLFDTERLAENSTIDSLDVRVSCTCPAFLYWGAQWNLHTRDSLEGQARPMLKAPERPGKDDFIVCKHIKVVADRIGPYLIRILEKRTGETPVKEAPKKVEKPKKAPEPKKPEPAPTKQETEKLQKLFKEEDDKKAPKRAPITTPAQSKTVEDKKPSDSKKTPEADTEGVKPVPTKTVVVPPEKKPEPAPTKQELSKLKGLFEKTPDTKPEEKPVPEKKEVKRNTPKQDNLEVKRKSRPGVLD